jgi:hypothetical protein
VHAAAFISVSRRFHSLARVKRGRGQPFVVERVRLAGSGVAIEGEFELPQLAQLNVEDQVFVTAFVRCHGSIKEMERIFGVSYPTIKSRLNRITQMLDFVETDPAPSRADIIDRLRRGDHRTAGTDRIGGSRVMPQLLTVRVDRADGRPLRIWVPVLPVMLVLSPFVILAALAAAVACLVYRVIAMQPFGTGWRFFCPLPGTRLEVHEGRTAVLVSIR